ALDRLVGTMPDAKALNRLIGPLPDARALDRLVGTMADARAFDRLVGLMPDAKALDRAIGTMPDAKALNRLVGTMADAKAFDRLAMLDTKALDRLVGTMPDARAFDRLVGTMFDAKTLDRLVGTMPDYRALTRPDLETLRERLAAQHRIDSGDVGPQELLDAATREAVFDDGDASSGSVPIEPRGRVDGDKPVTSGRIARAWAVLQVLLTLDNFLGDPGVTAVRETVGNAANEVLLLLLLVAVSQAPTPPPAPTVPVPKALTTPTHVAEGSTRATRCAERQTATLENKSGLTDGVEEPDPHVCDDGQ
ncbi:MAG: hypothetical protein OXH09_24880, partial [Gammaproteobacteria bacterium]|nr:hypothetical protein [Gammaproteobacteria bacterium]